VKQWRKRVGLLGGSFDPPHIGHVHIAKQALIRFDLDEVWLIVSPGNPLKDHQPAPIATRIAKAREMIAHPRIHVTDIEARLNTRYTSETLAQLVHLYPRNSFIWLMGADNLVQFDKWQDWRWIMESFDIGVLARSTDPLAALNARAARVYRDRRLPASQARRLGCNKDAQWCYLPITRVDLSSSEIRAQK
jgi:nicotinate-nucleotide adenylyltransferase